MTNKISKGNPPRRSLYLIHPNGPHIEFKGNNFLKKFLRREDLPPWINRFGTIIIEVDNTVDESRDKALLRKAIDSFKKIFSKWGCLTVFNAPKLIITFTRGKFINYNEVLVRLRTVTNNQKDLPVDTGNILLVSDVRPDEIGREDVD